MKRITVVALVTTISVFFGLTVYAADQPARQFGACQRYVALGGDMARLQKSGGAVWELSKGTIGAATGATLNYGFSHPSTALASKQAVAKGAAYGLAGYLIETIVEHTIKGKKKAALATDLEVAERACAEEQRLGQLEARMWTVEDRKATHQNNIEVAKIRSGKYSSVEEFASDNEQKLEEFANSLGGTTRPAGESGPSQESSQQRYDQQHARLMGQARQPVPQVAGRNVGIETTFRNMESLDAVINSGSERIALPAGGRSEPVFIRGSFFVEFQSYETESGRPYQLRVFMGMGITCQSD